MNNPKLYQESNDLQSNISQEVIKKYLKFIEWNQNGDDDIIDIGCGTGNVTVEILLPNFPSSIKRLLAVDVNTKMIKTALEKYSNFNSKVDFGVLDMGEEIPDNYKEKFNHVFSFFCLHWIQDQRLAMKNIFELLKPGGDTLFLMPCRCDQVYKNYEFMSKDSRWQPYMTDINDLLLPFRHDKYPERSVRNNLEDTGLNVKICEIIHREFIFSDDKSLRGFLESINPFVTRMPLDLKEEFMEIQVKRAKNQDPKRLIDGPTRIYIDMLVVCAKKFI